MKGSIVAKPVSVETTPDGAVKAVIQFQYEKPVSLPKGVPPLPTNQFTITAFVSPKQWKKVESALADPEDRLIFEGQAALDPILGLVLHCTNINSVKLQKAGREPKPETATPAS